MRRFVGSAAVLGLLVAGAALADQGPVTIKLKKAGPGQTVRETRTEKASNKISVTIMGQEQTKDEATASNFVYTDEVIERPDPAGKPTKLKRTYEKAEEVKNGQPVDLDLAGKTVLIEKKGDKYEFTIDGKPAGGKAAGLLAKEFSGKDHSSDKDFLPEKPVKPGDTWKVDVAKGAKEFAEGGLAIDPAASTATGKLVKVYDKGGHKYGVIEVTMELAVTKLKGQQEIPLKEGSKMTVTFSLDGCIDGTEAAGSGKMTLKGKLAGEGPGFALAMDMTFESKGETTEVKK